MPPDIRQRPGVVLTAAVILHVGIISAQVNTARGVPLIESLTFGAFSEVQRLTTNGVEGLQELWNRYAALRDVQAENDELRRSVQEMQVQLQEERALAQRTETLRRLLELRDRAGLQTAAAEVIAAGASPDFRTVTVDKGASDGLSRDMAVISPAGVVGRVILSGARASKVQLIIDRNAAVGALIERTRAQGLVLGLGQTTLQMEYVPGTADVKPGDLVVTSGIDGIYPKGFVIGTVDVVDRGPGTFHTISVVPAVDFSRLEEVLVVLTPQAGKDAEAETGAQTEAIKK